jgi:hypothetical protein
VRRADKEGFLRNSFEMSVKLQFGINKINGEREREWVQGRERERDRQIIIHVWRNVTLFHAGHRESEYVAFQNGFYASGIVALPCNPGTRQAETRGS